jgi:hypothetical protein
LQVRVKLKKITPREPKSKGWDFVFEILGLQNTLQILCVVKCNVHLEVER